MEPMSNKDPFETFLEQQSFSEKASESLRSRLEKSADWHRPWWQKPKTLIALLACLIIALLSVLNAFNAEIMPSNAVTVELPPVIEEPLSAPPPIVAQNRESEYLPPFQHYMFKAEPEFNLVFIDRPVNYLRVRKEYSDLI